jgi:hypothetical protein
VLWIVTLALPIQTHFDSLVDRSWEVELGLVDSNAGKLLYLSAPPTVPLQFPLLLLVVQLTVL